MKVGAGVGFTAGLVSSSYFWGITDRLDRASCTSAYGIATIAIGCILAGAPAGATMGASVYAANRAIKYVRVAPISVQIGGLMGALIAAKVSYELGRK